MTEDFTQVEQGAIYKPSKKDRKRYEQMSVCIITPCGGYDNKYLFTKCLANMIIYSMHQGIHVDAFGGTERMVIHWARQDLARQAKDRICQRTGEKYTHILWLDDDHAFTPDLLCVLALNGDKDLVSALYYGRDKALPVAYVKDKSPDKYGHYPLIWPQESFYEVDAIGFGACLMRRDVLDRVPEPWFQFRGADDEKGYGEDIYFCVRAKEYGVKIWLDARYKLGHIGAPHVVDWRDWQAYVKEHEQEFGEKIRYVHDVDGNTQRED